jgi:hypothetical protein
MVLALLVVSLFQRSNSVLEVPSLILVFLLDIGVDFNGFELLALDIERELLRHLPLELFKVIDVVNDMVNCVFELVDVDVVRSDLGPVFLDQVLKLLLAGSQVVDDVTKVGVDLVVVLQLLVHLLGLLLQIGNLELSGGDISLQLFDLVVKHEFEFF